MDRRLITTSFVLLCLQILFLLADLGYIPGFHFGDEGQSSQLNPVMGQIKSQSNHVRKKSEGQIFWKDASSNDSIHTMDSLLTLDQSSAQIEISGNSKIHIHENTLIVFEPIKQDQQANLVIMTVGQGQLNALAGRDPLQINKDQWKVAIKEGAELSFRSKGQDGFEVEVSKGEVQLVNSKNNSHQIVSPQSRVQVKTDKVRTLKIDASIQWLTPESSKSYHHADTVHYTARWQGEAEKLEVIHSGQVSSYDLNSQQTSFDLELPLGTHSLTLYNQNESSKTLTLEMLPAPLITYLSPLPRHRNKTGDQPVFAWSPDPMAQEYVIEISTDRNFTKPIRKTVQNNQATLSITDPNRYFWRIIPVDASGISAPASYSNELHIIDNPLRAPSAITPSEPAHESDSQKGKAPQNNSNKQGKVETQSPFARATRNILSLFISTAHAESPSPTPLPDKNIPVRIEWTPIDQATHYTLEIASDPLFYDVVVETNVKTTYFVWSDYQLPNYYWRVAGSNGEQMGLFSAVNKMVVRDHLINKVQDPPPAVSTPLPTKHPDPVAPVSVASLLPKKMTRSTKVPAKIEGHSLPTTTNTDKASAIAATKAPGNNNSSIHKDSLSANAVPMPTKPWHHKISVFAASGFRTDERQLTNQDVKVSASGFGALDLGFEWSFFNNDQWEHFIRSYYSAWKWSFKDSDTQPFQNDLLDQLVSFQYKLKNLTARHSYTLTAIHSSLTSREGPEQVTSEQQLDFAVGIEWQLPTELFHIWQIELGALIPRDNNSGIVFRSMGLWTLTDFKYIDWGLQLNGFRRMGSGKYESTQYSLNAILNWNF